MVVDGYVYFHVLPPVFDELMESCSSIQLAPSDSREPLYWPRQRLALYLPMINVVKNIALHALSMRANAADGEKGEESRRLYRSARHRQ